MTDRIPGLPIDRHILNLSETCLYLINFGLEPFFSENCKKNVYHKSKPKGEKILMSVDGFLGKFYFLTSVALKFYQNLILHIQK